MSISAPIENSSKSTSTSASLSAEIGAPTLPVDAPKNRKSLDSLTALRFFAAFSIVVYHAKDQFPFLSGLAANFALEQAVSFFFVLSGFILTYAHSNLGLDNCKPYIISRFMRIYPVHLAALATLLFLLPQNLAHFKDWPASLAYLTMTHAWVPIQDYYFAWNSPSWSISTEWFFYLSLPLLLTLGRKRLLAPLTLTALTFAFVFWLSAWQHLPTDSTTGSAVSAHGLLYINPLARLIEFALGITLGLTYTRIKPLPLPTLLEFLSLASFLFTCHLSTKLESFSAWHPYFLLWASHAGFSALSAAFVIIVFSQERGILSKALRFKPLVLLGEVSFAMYMLHYILLCYKFETVPLIYNQAGFWRFTAILVLASYFTFTYIEKPTRSLFKAKKNEKNSSQRKWLLSRSELVGLLAVPALIYALTPGTSLYQKELSQGTKIASPNCLFNGGIALETACLSNNDIVLRFKAQKPIILFQTVETRLLNAKGETIYFLQTALTTRPQFASQGSHFDYKMPNCSSAYQQAKFLSIKVMNRDGKALPTASEPQQSKLMIALKATN
ncbi:MAG: acyltransferase [Candidatus Melainabacteria bacterium]|nr:acyltransferase [Candidatus Melainabacteria bacterium]